MTESFLKMFKRFTPDPGELAALERLIDFKTNISKEKKTVVIDAVFDTVIYADVLYGIEHGIKEAYALNECTLMPVFKDCAFERSYASELVRTLELYYGKAYPKGFLGEYSAELYGDSLVFSLRAGLMVELMSDLVGYFETIIEKRFGEKIKVVFSSEEGAPDNGREEELIKSAQEDYRARAAAGVEKEKPVGCDNRSLLPVEGEALEYIEDGIVRSGRLTFDISDKKLVYGSESNAKLIPIRDIAENRRCAFLCRMFMKDERESRDGGSVKYTLGVTDLDSSVNVRLSVDKASDELTPHLKENAALLICGTARTDDFDGELSMRARTVYLVKQVLKTDTAPEKRVELHLHTTLSANDALCDPAAVVATATRWGMPAIAVTDHGNVQAFPEIMTALEKSKSPVKPLYGIEGYLVDDTARAVYGFEGHEDVSFSEGTFTVFDIETTGLSPIHCAITEIGAVKYRGGVVTETFDTFVDPGTHIPENITELTGITDEMVAGAPSQRDAVEAFLNFAGDTVLVAHNANFDISFIRRVAEENKLIFDNPYIDTVAVSRHLNPELKRHRLDSLRDYFKLGEFNHHRASDDCEMLARIFECMIAKMKPDGVESVNQMIDEMAEKSDPRRLKPYHATILVKNKTGLKNLYKLVSYSYLDYYYRYPRIPKTVLEQHREGLIVGSACASGEIFQLLMEDRPYGDIMKAADFYDYFEIMPDSNNGFLIDEGKLASAEDLHRLNRRILEIADKQKKPCVATGDVHFMEPDDEIYRQLLKNGQKYTDAFRTTGMYLKTTDEMLKEFAYLGDRAYEVVVTNTRKVADMIEDGVRPIPKGTYPPSIDGAEEELVQCCNEKARRLYGDPLPEIVQKRLDRELGAIIEHHFAVLYIIARKLVANSESKGYLVGSRGSVGSSVVAMLADISEVNPLPPHRRCPNCRYSEFFTDGSVGSGFDLDDANCPECGTKMVCDGHDIPFETFLGFKGDKAPDIDLNFSGNVQSDAHKYTETLFGKENIFRAGTVGTIAFKTAYGYVKKYLEDKGISLSKAEINRLSSGCVGVKRTTGQHPGGIIVVPKEYEVYDFTPVQHPAEKESSGVVTTHFAFEFLHDTILKLDMLGHDVPTMYKILEDYTGIDVRDVPLNDKTVYSLFTSPAALGVTPESIMCETGTLGLPEMGTPYVRGMLLTAKPKNFSDLLQISGLSHGTGIWLGNGEELIKNGTCTIDTIIGTRDSIMLTLLQKGLEPSSAFKIMESVRKGKGVSEEFEAEMHEHEVPDWYIASCRKIKYMFPKAHAAAYVLAALRLAWFKVFRPVEYYATYFSARPDGFDYDIAMQPKSSLMQYLEECKKRNDLSQKEEATADCMQIVNEMYARGISFLPVDVLKSSVSSFVPENGRIRLPFIAISGLGLSVAQNIFDAVKSGVSTVEELRACPGVGRSIVDLLQEKGCLASLPESDQLSFF